MSKTGNYPLDFTPSVNPKNAGIPAKNGEMYVAPPTNRGVLATFAEKTEQKGPKTKQGLDFQNQVVLDWLTCTFPYDEVLMAYIEGEFGGMTIRERGMMGYTHSASILDKGSFCWSPSRKDQRMCLVLPASALALLDIPAMELIEWCADHNGTFTRLDLAVDDFEGILDLDIIREHLQKGWLSTRWRIYRPEGTMDIGSDSTEGETTIYIGSRASESFTRVYDKVVEMEAKGMDPKTNHWVRFELETKGKRADALARQVLEAEKSGGYILDYINGLIEFKEPNDSDSNKWRWETAQWWTDFIKTVDKTRLSLPKPERTIEKTRTWVRHSVAPGLAVMLGAGLYSDLMAIAVEGANRWGVEHAGMLSREGIDLAQARLTIRAIGEAFADV